MSASRSYNSAFIGPFFADGVGEQHLHQADALGVAAGEHRGAGRNAVGLRGVELVELPAGLGDLVDVRRVDDLGAEAGEIVVADVVG